MPPAPDMTNCAEKTWTGALELEGARVCEGRKKAWVKMRNSYPFIEATKAERLSTSLLRIAYFPSATIDGTWGLPIPVLMIRGHDLCFDRTCQGSRLAIRAEASCEKTVRIMTWL